MTVLSDRWIQSPSYPGYEISNTGFVRSKRTGHILALRTKKGKHPYQRVHLCHNGKARYVLVHRLVLEAFVGPCPDGKQALHLDNNPKNNHINNLRWGTPKENHQTINRTGTANGRSKLTETEVLAIRSSAKPHAELARQYQVTDTTIQNIRTRKLWKHL
jgi:hypothetical protein